MELHKKLLVSIVLFLSGAACKCVAQSPAAADTSIVVTAAAAGYDFSILLPSLTQIPGAPPPFYTYLWDFGDGHFSFDANPRHSYARPGEYDVYLYAVNNYDDGKKPSRQRKKVSVSAGMAAGLPQTAPVEKDFFKANGVFELRYNAMAKPGDTMVLIAGWKNPGTMPDEGTLYVLINEKTYDQTCFDTLGARFFNEEHFLANAAFDPAAIAFDASLKVTESGSPASAVKYAVSNKDAAAANLLTQTFSVYKHTYALDLGTLAPGKNNFSFLELRVTPEMIRDTNATVVVTGVYVPKKGDPVMHRLNIPVVNSHDPNKMNLKGGRLGYRFLKKNKELTYKVRFQNTGKGPARKVALDMSLFPSLDPQTITVKDLSPYCGPCQPGGEKRGCWELEKKDSGAVFTFYGIYLPGTDQKGVQDKDSTKGFMEFSIVTRKKLENRPFRSRTAIYFDNNDPIITNYATGRFKKSPSPLVMAGYEAAFGGGRVSNGITTGIALAPLAPYRPYFQFELFYKQGLKTTSERVSLPPGVLTDPGTGRLTEYRDADSTASHTISQLKFIPLHFRYNMNDYVGIGVGASATVDVGGTVSWANNYYLPQANQEQTLMATTGDKSAVKSFSNWRFQPFADLQLGKVRWGPHLGFRYYYNSNKNSFGYFYAGWRF